MLKVGPNQLSLSGDLHTTGITPSTFQLLAPSDKMAWGHPFLSLKRTINLTFSKQ